MLCDTLSHIATMQPSFDLTAAQNATSDQKLDMLLAAMGSLLEGQAKIEKLTSTVCSLEKKVASQEATITTMQKEMKRMKEQLNDNDQQSRTQFVRLFNDDRWLTTTLLLILAMLLLTVSTTVS